MAEHKEGTHVAEFYVEIVPDLGYGDRVNGIRAVKMTKNKPALRGGSFAMKVGIRLDDAMWRRIVPEAVIEVPIERTGSVEIEVEPAPVDLGPAEIEAGG